MTAAEAPSPRGRLPSARLHIPRPAWAPGQLRAKGVTSHDVAAAPGLTGLPDGLKAGVEALSGFAMDDVRVHRNSPEPAKVGARAYAQGSDIHLGPGQEQHLPHEAWHVVQQKQGLVRPTVQLKGALVNDDRGLEHEADVMGARAKGGHVQNIDPGRAPAAQTAPAGSPMQLQPLSDEDFIARLGLSDEEKEAFRSSGDTLEGWLIDNFYYGSGDPDQEDRRVEVLEAVQNSEDITQNQAEGLQSIAGFIVDQYPPADFDYIGIGRSPVLVLEFLRQKHHGRVHELPMAELGKFDLSAALESEHQVYNFKRLIESIIPVNSRRPFVVIDYAENGASIRIAVDLLRTIFPEERFEMMALFSGSLPGRVDDNGFERINEDPSIVAFLKRLRLEIGKGQHSGFQKFNVARLGAGEAPQVNQGGVERRRDLVAGLPGPQPMVDEEEQKEGGAGPAGDALRIPRANPAAAEMAGPQLPEVAVPPPRVSYLEGRAGALRARLQGRGPPRVSYLEGRTGALRARVQGAAPRDLIPHPGAAAAGPQQDEVDAAMRRRLARSIE